MTTAPASPVTLQATPLSFVIATAQWLGNFDRLQVWRSRTGPNGIYEELTGGTAGPAVLPVGFVGSPPSPPVSGPAFPLNGRQLQFVLNGVTSATILFAGTDPISLGAAATQINAQAPNVLFSYVYGATLVVQTVQAGAAASLQCIAGDAVPIVGLSTDPSAIAFGQDARLVLQPSVENYAYVDPNGSSEFFYKIRFSNSVTGLTGEFSIPFRSGPLQVPPSNFVRCYLDLVDAQGQALCNREVLFYTKFTGATAGVFTVAGDPFRVLTDSNGHAEVMLVRGTQLTVAIGGTDLARQVTVPTDLSVVAVNLLDPSIGQDDLFNVQVPQLDYATRRTL